MSVIEGSTERRIMGKADDLLATEDAAAEETDVPEQLPAHVK